MALSKIGSAGLPSGSVIQVVQGIEQKDSNEITSSSSFVALGPSVTITPSSTSSKIFLTCSVFLHPQAGNICTVSLFRDSTNLATNSSTRWAQVRGDADPDASGAGYGQYARAHMDVLDSPSTTSAITYTFRGNVVSGGSSLYLPSGAVNTITAIEIVG
jgi:hypothetical protein